MYWLKEVVGEAVVDRALAKLLQQFAFKGPPYPNSKDFLAILRAEAGPQHDALITDLFEKNHAARPEDHRGHRAQAARRLVRAEAGDRSPQTVCRRQGPGKRGAAGRGDRRRRVHGRARQDGLRGQLGAGAGAPAHRQRQADRHADAGQGARVGRCRPVQQAHRPQFGRQPEGGGRAALRCATGCAQRAYDPLMFRRAHAAASLRRRRAAGSPGCSLALLLPFAQALAWVHTLSHHGVQRTTPPPPVRRAVRDLPECRAVARRRLAEHAAGHVGAAAGAGRAGGQRQPGASAHRHPRLLQPCAAARLDLTATLQRARRGALPVRSRPGKEHRPCAS